MVWLGPVESEDRLDRRALEPRVLLEGQEQLSLVEQQPEAVLGDVGYFSLRSVSSREKKKNRNGPSRKTVGLTPASYRTSSTAC
jgi:hypothetical protein